MDRNSEARWYFAESTDRSAFYDLFFQICQQYHVDWATATDQEKAFVEEVARTTWEKADKTETEGVRTMYSVSEEIRNEENAESVKNLMKNLDLPFEEACNVLKIPAERRPAVKEIMQQFIADDAAPDFQAKEEKI